jgi:C1A family cysteine protease
MSINITKEHENNKTKVFRIGGQVGVADMGGGVSVKPVNIVLGNTNIDFTKLQTIQPSKVISGLSDITTIPENFTWRYDQTKGGAITTPGNQGLCGSCWAISSAGIISDNFVVSGLNIDQNNKKFKPDLSTTWILINYPQQRCGGGNPSIALQQIVNSSRQYPTGGLVSNRCIDYSWCMTRQECNGNAKKHMEANPVLLNTLIPQNAGCYDANVKHYLFKLLKDPITVAIGQQLDKQNPNNVIKSQDWNKYKLDIKKHIYTKGPVLGGFLVFKNFMNGAWAKTKPNKGIYLEKGVYQSINKIDFNDNQIDSSNFVGSHAVAIIGWGKENNVETSPGKKETVEYWYCRNSWTEKWGDGGYFKIAMFPHNQLSQFDKIVQINSKNGKKQAGGIVMIEATQKPTLKKLDKVNVKPGIVPNTIKDKSYYSKNASDNIIGKPQKNPDNNGNDNGNSFNKYIYIFLVILLLILLGIFIYFYTKKGKKGKRSKKK